MRHALRLAALVALLALGARASTADETGAQGSYQFASGYSSELQLPLLQVDGALQLRWPESAPARWDTALLGVQIASAGAEPWVEISAGTASVLQYLDFSNHFYNNFFRGVINLMDVVYFLSVAVFFLFVASRVVESRRWR